MWMHDFGSLKRFEVAGDRAWGATPHITPSVGTILRLLPTFSPNVGTIWVLLPTYPLNVGTCSPHAVGEPLGVGNWVFRAVGRVRAGKSRNVVKLKK